MRLRKKTALHLIDSGGIYGIERMIISLLPKLKQRGYDAALACLNSQNDATIGFSNSFSDTMVSFFHPRSPNKFGIQILPFLFNTLKCCNPTVIHLHGYKATILGGCFALLMRIPSVATYHGEAKHSPGLAKYLKIETQILRRIQGVISVSNPIKKELEQRKILNSRIVVIANGTDDCSTVKEEAKTYAIHSERHPLVLFVGRLIEKKNVHILISVIARLKREFARIGLLVAGDGPFRENLVEQAKRLGMADSVTFLGYVDNVYLLYNMCDCLVLPSKTEGTPITLLEAMACSTPIVASSVGAVPGIVSHEVDALTVEPNDEGALYQALKRLFNSPLLQKRLAINARNKFLRYYTSDIMADRYKTFYDSILLKEGVLKRT